jgi:predicted nucleic acid-binding protein
VNVLLDTNVISEWTKPAPSPSVAGWLGAVPEETTFLSVITLGEIRRGVNRLAEGRRAVNAHPAVNAHTVTTTFPAACPSAR